MGLADKLFGGKKSVSQSKGVKADPEPDPQLIQMYDEYGREVSITKKDWREKVLPNNLKKVRNDPERLYSMLVSAIGDGLASEIVPYAEHLQRTDPIPSRGTTILGIVYMEAGRLDDAQRLYDDFLAGHGEDGVVLTNLAKVYSLRGDNQRAETILWHALEVDPNQEKGLGWYLAIKRERNGESAVLDALRSIAGLPGSWRAQLWLAKDALQRRDLTAAQVLYGEALAAAGRPVPADLLMQMSGDLGQGGYLAEALGLTEPFFDPAFHGLTVGNNLIKANIDLGRLEKAALIIDQLYAQKRPDWREVLRVWETEMAKTRAEAEAVGPSGKTPVSLMAIEGPLWMRDGSPFAELSPEKERKAPRIAMFGGTALLPQAHGHTGVQLTDSPGRLSRSAPMVLAEHIHLATDAVGVALIPWVQGLGFAVLGAAYGDRELCGLVEKGADPPGIVVRCIVNTTQATWRIHLHIVRIEDRSRLEEISVETSPDNAGTAVDQLAEKLVRSLAARAGLNPIPPPAWYQRPAGPDATDYLLRVEQQLAVVCTGLDSLHGGGLTGEREILDGALQLCLRQPANPTVRMVFANTLRQTKKVRPAIVVEYREKADLLQRQYPLPGAPGGLVAKVISEVFPD
jgi:tetratricopeptide (TPR) repeat protein